jgi:hypothetical protein
MEQRRLGNKTPVREGSLVYDERKVKNICVQTFVGLGDRERICECSYCKAKAVETEEGEKCKLCGLGMLIKGY